jgi:Holliday junction DNA helicase RuvB
MEDYALDIIIGKGPSARTLRINLPRITIIGATTKMSLISAPLRDRFGMHFRLEFYTPQELAIIIKRSASILGVKLADDGAQELAMRARGTPRIANRLLRRVRDYADVKADGSLNSAIAGDALKLEGVDDHGLDDLDRNFLSTIIRIYNGGPVGVEAIAATLNEEVDTLVDMVEPFLLQQGFVSRTKSGRKANESAYRLLNLPMPGAAPRTLFD